MHTAGPWNYNGQSHAVYGNLGCVANCTAAVSPHHEDERDANCRLIASAPELLSALEVIIADWGHLLPDAHRETAHAAIAKATGG